MIDKYYEDYFLCPVVDFWISKPYSSTHTGIDFGWHNIKNCNVYPIQDGKVVDNFYSSTCGNAVVVQHDYSDGTHRFSAYLHLRLRSPLKIGTEVYTMLSPNKTAIGIRGNTGLSSGDHLHLYVTAKTTKAYSWTLIGHSYANQICNFNPLPNIYLSKNIRYYLASDDKVENYPCWEDIPEPITYPTPVERNTKVKQVEVLIDYLYMREAPSGTAYDEYAIKGIYNVVSEEISGAYNWYKIDEINGKSFWLASGGTRTSDLLPELSQEQLLQNKVAEMQKEYDILDEAYESLKVELTTAQATAKELATKIAKAIKELS